MRCRATISSVSLTQGYGVHVFTDLAAVGPKNYAVGLTRHGELWAFRGDLDAATAFDQADEQVCILGNMGPTSWRSVLARLIGTPEPPAGVWQDSVAEIASRYFEIGTWCWLITLVEARRTFEQRQRETEG